MQQSPHRQGVRLSTLAALILGTVMAGCTVIAPEPPPAAEVTVPAASSLAQLLGTAPDGSVVPLASGGAPVGDAQVENVYVAASGRTCRRVVARLAHESVQLAVCEAAGRWTFAPPLRYSAAAEQMVSGRISVL